MQLAVPPLQPVDDPRAVLTDGSVAVVRLSEPGDAAALTRFFHELTRESLRRRFFVTAEPSAALVASMSDSRDPTSAATLLAIRVVDGEPHPIAVGSYFAIGHGSAEVAFAVDDRFQGKGLGTLLLERLATIATAHGFRRFEATTLPDNMAMLDLFHESGFEIRSRSEYGAIAVQLSLSPTADTVASIDRRHALATAGSLRPMFDPASVAVVGASRDPSHIGGRILRALQEFGYGGAIYPINPHAAEIGGLPCYGTVAAAPGRIDLAVVAVPREHVLAVVDDCAAAGVRALVVITAGFAETGDEGRALQRQLVDKVRGYGMRMVGPNCMGLLNTKPSIRLNASFSPIVPPAGGVALSSQSGALGMAILKLAADRGVGLSTFVSVGNKGDVSGNDLLQYWEADPQTRVILLYLESFGNARRFGRLARRIARVKPIVAIKAGRTIAGSRAAGSHTAALAASDIAVDALFQQSGVIRAGTIDEMFDIAACLEMQPLPQGRRVAIVTNAGGPGILAVDACESAGLVVAPFPATTSERLATFLPVEASLANPVDMIASAEPNAYRRTIETVLATPEIDALIVIYTPIDVQRTADTLQAIRNGITASRQIGGAGKPVLACVMADGQSHPKPLDLGTERVPAYAFPENAARALAAVTTYAEWRGRPPGLFWSFEDVRADDARTTCQTALSAHGDGWLTTDDTRAVLGSFGLPLAAGTIARSADEAAALAHVLGFPVAAKLASRCVPHKTDVGAVRLDLATEQSVRRAFVDIMTCGRRLSPEGEIEGVLIQAMVTGAVETMIGVTNDPLFGPLVAFGLGGVYVEILGDVHFRVAPLTDRDVDDLLNGIRGLPLLQGYRGHPPGDVDALRELLLRVSRLAVEVPEIAELDLNPVMALPPGHGCRIVDARIRVKKN